MKASFKDNCTFTDKNMVRDRLKDNHRKNLRQFLSIRPLKVDCLFCIPACVALAMIQTKTHRCKMKKPQHNRPDCSHFRAPAYKLEFLRIQNRQSILNGLTDSTGE